MDKRKLLRRTLRLAAAPLALAWSAQAHGQAAVSQDSAAPQPVAQVGEVVVTSQKRSELLSEVPIQIDAFTAQQISDAGIKTTEDALAHVANITFDHGDTYHGTFITARGLTEINNADPPVSVVVDGVPLVNQKQLNLNLFDIQQIEVLKGPQGSLYGRNAEGGAINITTQQPTNNFHGYGDFTYTNGDYRDLTAGVSGPLIQDKLLFRLSGDAKSRDGLIDNTFRGDESDFINHDDTVRGQLIYHATDRLTLDGRLEYNDFRGGSNYYSAVFSSNPNDFELPQFNFPSFTYGNSTSATLKGDYKFDFGTLTSISNYYKLEEIDRADLDFRNPVQSPLGIFGAGFQAGQGQNQFLEQESQEVRLASRADQRFRWLIGGYYLHTNRALVTRAFVDVDSQPSEFDTIPLLFANQSTNDHNDAYAGFAQVDFDILPNLTLTGALRYDNDRREQINLVSGSGRTADFNRLQPKATLTYRPAPDRLVYITYGTGFRSGGFNAPAAPIPLFADEHLDNYEAGFKAAFFSRRLQINGAAYLSNVENYQFFFVDATTASQVIGNIEHVRIKGVEFEVNAALAPGLDFNGAVGATDTDIRRSSIFPDAVGKYTPRTIPVSATASLQYRRRLLGDLDGLARADWKYYGDKYWGVDNAAVQNPYSIVNLRVGIERGGLGIYAFSNNLLNSDYYSEYFQKNYSGLDIDFGYRGEPRTYGVELRGKF